MKKLIATLIQKLELYNETIRQNLDEKNTSELIQKVEVRDSLMLELKLRITGNNITLNEAEKLNILNIIKETDELNQLIISAIEEEKRKIASEITSLAINKKNIGKFKQKIIPSI